MDVQPVAASGDTAVEQQPAARRFGDATLVSFLVVVQLAWLALLAYALLELLS
ncbi:MAG TPA: hypothetical protein VGC78_13805 [Gaiellaceae bacterium]|jgi:hypothetical protein